MIICEYFSTSAEQIISDCNTTNLSSHIIYFKPHHANLKIHFMSTTSQDFIRKLRESGYVNLTPIQRLAIPKVLSGTHLLIIAPTGHGKTEAAIIPIMYNIYMKRPKKISALYLTPLRALNRDIQYRLDKLGQSFQIKVSTRHGDSTRKERRDLLQDPPDLLISTPETLLYLLVDKRVRELLTGVRWVVIDEVQEMLDEKRGYELSVMLQRLRLIARNPQMIGLSATLGDVELAKTFLSTEGEVEVVKIEDIKSSQIIIEIPSYNEELVNEAVKHRLDPSLMSRLKRLKEIIEENRPVLIFTNTRETAEFLASELTTLYGLKVASHHGSLSREVRVKIEREFKEAKLDALVATSSLELGIDIGSINLVVQYMSPRQVLRLLQRVGRSGHSIEKTSRGIILPGNSLFDVLECQAIYEASKRGYIEPVIYETNPLDVVAHEVVGMVLEGITSLDEILDIFRKSPFFRSLSLEDLKEVVEQLEAEKILVAKEGKLRLGRRSWRYYFTTNMIPDSNRSYIVVEVETGMKLGNLDNQFVTGLEEDSIFVLGGRLWKVISIEEGKVFVSRAEPKKGILPSWFGESIPVEKEISMMVYSYLSEMMDGKREGVQEVSEKIKEHVRRNYPKLGPNKIVVELVGSDLVVVHSPFGSRGNNTLGTLLSAVLGSGKGLRPTFRSDPYHVVIASVSSLSLEDIEFAIKSLREMDERYATSVLSETLKETPQFKWALFTEAQRFGAVEKGADIKLTQHVLRTFSDTVVGKEAVKELLSKHHDLSVLEALRQMDWEVVRVPSPSPLAQEFLDKLMVSSTSEDKPLILEVFKRRMLSKEILLACLICGWNQRLKVEDTPQRCPKCGSIFLTATYPEDKEALQVIRKNISGEKLRRNEAKRLSELKRVASLFSNYGRTALVAFVVRGVGPSNLGRLLSFLSQGEDVFYRELMEEEKKFLRYRKFWQ